jgi:hypothetical protein
MIDGYKQELDAQSEDDQFRALLVSGNLKPGIHQLRLEANSNDTEENGRQPTFDIDYAIITAGDGDSS